MTRYLSIKWSRIYSFWLNIFGHLWILLFFNKNIKKRKCSFLISDIPLVRVLTTKFLDRSFCPFLGLEENELVLDRVKFGSKLINETSHKSLNKFRVTWRNLRENSGTLLAESPLGVQVAAFRANLWHLGDARTERTQACTHTHTSEDRRLSALARLGLNTREYLRSLQVPSWSPGGALYNGVVKCVEVERLIPSPSGTNPTWKSDRRCSRKLKAWN